MDALGEPVAVQRTRTRQDLEDEQVEGALQAIVRMLRHIQPAMGSWLGVCADRGRMSIARIYLAQR